MFQNACNALRPAPIPIVIVVRRQQGEVAHAIGAGIIINDEGWFVTAGHIVAKIGVLDQQVGDYRQGHRTGQNDVTDYAAIMGDTNAQLSGAVVNSELDIGAGKLEGYNAPPGHVFPRFRVREVEQGELLCRLGYPFVDSIRASWVPDRGFSFTNLFPVPVFVNEALVSRFAQRDDGVWIETSSPGLKGQSGGPLVDSDGCICGIQINTRHYPLGFEGSGRDQVLNVGRAVHVESVKRFLDTNNINYLQEEHQ